METIVAKFGGSSLADGEQFKKVKNIVLDDERRRIVVPSAPGKAHAADQKVTDLLYLLYEISTHRMSVDSTLDIIRGRYRDIVASLGLTIDIDAEIDIIADRLADGASVDYLASRGEYLNGKMLSEYLGYKFVDAADVVFFDDDGILDDEKSYKAIALALEKYERIVVPGFYGMQNNGEIKTFSRGGSDLTGSVCARAVGASCYENWTDVSGFLMSDPRIVDNPKRIDYITYRELRELSYSGANILHEDSIFPVIHAGIPIHIKNTNRPSDPGTYIVDEDFEVKNRGLITGVTGKKGFAIINVRRARSNKDIGFNKTLVGILEANGINLEHLPSSIDALYAIVDASAVKRKEEKIMREIAATMYPDNLIVEKDIAVICVVGKGMKHSPAALAKIFQGLSDANINTRAVLHGSSKISVIIAVSECDYERAINSIYNSFCEEDHNGCN